MGAAARGSVGLALALTWLVACTKGTDATPSDSSIPPDPAATAIREPDGPDVRNPAPGDSAGPRGPATPSRALRSIAPPSSGASSTRSPSTPPPAARPLAEWMRGPLTDAFNAGDLEAIARSFERMAGWAPAGYANWRSIAEDGARSARAGSLDAVKAACRGCHAEYEARYKQERTNKPLP